MKPDKVQIICAIIQVVFGSVAVAAFVVVALSGERVTRFIPAGICSVVLVIQGVCKLLKKNPKE